MWAGLTTVVLDGDLLGRKLILTAHANKQRAAPPVSNKMRRRDKFAIDCLWKAYFVCVCKKRQRHLISFFHHIKKRFFRFYGTTAHLQDFALVSMYSQWTVLA